MNLKLQGNLHAPISMSVALVFALLVLPAVNALPAKDVGNGKCDLDLHTADLNEVQGRYENNGWEVSFSASLQSNTIYSRTVATNTSDDDFELTIRLSFLDSKHRTVPGIEELVVEAAKELAEATQCSIPDRFNEVYEDLADKLYQCTMELGLSQLRFSIMYHETIVASALRICSGAETICTPSPKYVYGNGMFICSEDLEELFPNQMEAGRVELERIKQHSLEIPTSSSASRSKRWDPVCAFTHSCHGLEGGDWGCCDNYAGCCRHCRPFCVAHDAICTCCTWWWCGPSCQRDWWCSISVPFPW